MNFWTQMKQIRKKYRIKELMDLGRENYLLETTYMGINNLLRKLSYFIKYYIVY